MSVTTTKTRHSSQIALARFADDLERLQLQQLFQSLQQKKEIFAPTKTAASSRKRCLSKNKFFQHRSPRLADFCLCAWELIEHCDANPFGWPPAGDRLYF